MSVDESRRYLNKGGAELWLVDRYKAHMDKVASDGMTFVTPSGEELLTGFHTAYSAEDIGVMDMVILMVKATQTDGNIPPGRQGDGPYRNKRAEDTRQA